MIKITNIYLFKECRSIIENEMFDIFVKVQEIPPLRSILGVHSILHFDTRYICVLNYDVNGSILHPILSPPIVRIDNCKGIVDFNVGRKDSYIGVNEGLLYKITCKGKRSGCTKIMNCLTDIRDYSGITIHAYNHSLNVVIE
ncbi:MAG: hypothetical protein ACRC7N_09540 [Clostridium sp.]